MKAAILKLDTPTPNGRIYPKEEMEKVIANLGSKAPLFGEMIGGDEYRETFINIGNISHRVDKLWIEEDTLYADITVLNTPRGKELQILSETEEVGRFSPRGVGNVADNGKVSEYDIIAIDYIPNEKLD